MYIERRHRKFIARHDIPKALRPVFEGRREFNQVLHATARGVAEIEASKLKTDWLVQIDRARRGLPPVPPQTTEAPAPNGERPFDHQGWRKFIRGAKTDAERRDRGDHVIEAIEEYMGLGSWTELEQPGWETEREEFGHLVALATGATMPFLESLDDYLASLRLVETSRAAKKTQLQNLGETFTTTADVTTDKVQDWITAKVKADNASKLTIHKYLGALRDYLRYIAKHQKVRAAVQWDALDLEGREKLDKLPYPPAAVVKFEKIARDRGSEQLADLICIARYTGARASELHNLRGDDIDLKAMSINIRGTKNKSAKRTCPIHTDLLPVLKRMIEETGNGPLFPGVERTALTQAFLRMKAKAKDADGKPLYGELYDFHSIRRTVIDMFRNAGAREEIVASFVGHKVKTITYGLYAGPPPLSVQAETMALLKYPEA